MYPKNDERKRLRVKFCFLGHVVYHEIEVGTAIIAYFVDHISQQASSYLIVTRTKHKLIAKCGQRYTQQRSRRLFESVYIRAGQPHSR